MFDHILVPVDGSDDAEVVLERAIELAERHDAAVHGLYVVDTRAFLTLSDDLAEQTAAELRAAGKRVTASLADRAATAGVEATTEIRTGKPAEEILGVVENNVIDLIVMGSHDSSDQRGMLGSVSQQVVRESPVSVLTVALGGRAEQLG